MSDQPLDLRRVVQLLWRRKFLVASAAALGLLAGAGYAARYPPLVSSTALVVLSPTVNDPATQAVIVASEPVLAEAVTKLKPDTSLDSLRSQLQVKRPTSTIISINTEGKTAAVAEGAANAVADSYIAFASSGNSPAGRARPHLLQPATSASGTSLPIHMIIIGGFGLLLGTVLGAIGALAISRRDNRLRRRDDIADAIGIPVLASLAVAHPSEPAAWIRLLEDYQPGTGDGWRLRKALHYLELAEAMPTSRSPGGSSLTVLSLSSDPKALALGPQLAVFAASIGIPTALIVGPQQNANATAALRAACAGTHPPPRGRRPQLIVSDQGGTVTPPQAGLSIAVAVVDGLAPRVTGLIRTHTTVLGVSAGAVTAGQLARVAATAAADGRHLSAILVADPDPSDHTTGRVPQLTRSAGGRMPSRIIGASMKAKS
jgi:capsular polysaccharide biosynthesis protein